MNIDNEIIMVNEKVEAIEKAGYTKLAAIELIKTAALVKLAGCVRENSNLRNCFNVNGSVATYEQ